MNEMIGSILNDPESMKQIQELAEMLKSEGGTENSDSTNSGEAQPSSGGMDFSSLAGLMGAMSGASGGSGPDLGMIAEIGKAISGAGSQDKNSDLLLALRPHLTPERQDRVDKAVKLLRIYAIIMILKDSGMLGKLL